MLKAAQLQQIESADRDSLPLLSGSHENDRA
jgi:hypothetical protein